MRLLIMPPPGPTPFPYTTLFRSGDHIELVAAGAEHGPLHRVAEQPVRGGLHVRDVLDLGTDTAHHAHDRLQEDRRLHQDRKSTRLNSSHLGISYAVFCLKKKNNN